MSKVKKRILIGIAIFVALNIILALPIASFIEVQVLKSKGNREITLEDYQREWVAAECGIDSYAYDEEYFGERILIPSSVQKDYSIPAFYYHTNTDKRGFVVMAHGMNASHITSYPEARVFLNAGFDVFGFDERKCGESSRDTISYGYFEGLDTADVFRYAYDLEMKEASDSEELSETDYAEDKIICGLWGRSLGGAACMNALDETGVKGIIDFVILDCPIGAMDELTGAPAIQNKLAGVINKAVMGYSFQDQNPYPQMEECDANVLVIIAGADTVAPKTSTEKIRSILRNSSPNYREYIGEGMSHAKVWIENPAEYERVVDEFLESCE